MTSLGGIGVFKTGCGNMRERNPFDSIIDLKGSRSSRLSHAKVEGVTNQEADSLCDVHWWMRGLMGREQKEGFSQRPSFEECKSRVADPVVLVRCIWLQWAIYNKVYILSHG